ncbi:MAG: cobalamin biosynthesis protein [Deltaproteobacteria bacterium]|jgi:cobalt-precorrin 5A hydrolase|nr:cobalamin biosynthesis protein [Deltaproteobacteria bacterium]
MSSAQRDKEKLAVYALTMPGRLVAEKIVQGLGAELFLTERLSVQSQLPNKTMKGICGKLSETWDNYSGHIIIAATGLVVRAICPYIKDKKSDPAVVTLGQDGRYVISLLSGHLGGGNELAKKVALVTGGIPIINTATDIASKPAMEVLARDLGLIIEDFGPLAAVSRELSEGAKVPVYDPHGFLLPHLTAWEESFPPLESTEELLSISQEDKQVPFIYVDYIVRPLAPGALVIRPPALAVGMGCHHSVELNDLKSLLFDTLGEFNLSPLSLSVISTAEIRGSEPAILELSRVLDRPLVVQPMDSLAEVETPNPSDTVFKRIGVFSVCEAAAQLAARMGPILVPKRKNKKATCAIALMNYSS